jgi:GNAT superfamily N-acetyltransferase
VNSPQPIVLKRYDASGARANRAALVAVYAEVYAAQLDNPFYSVERFGERFEGQTARPGFALVTAHSAVQEDGAASNGTGAAGGFDDLLGYAYGMPLAPTTLWWDGLLDPLSAELLVEDGTRTFAINEIMVRAPWRRRGIAKRLHDALLADRQEKRATLLVDPSNAPARAAYASWGWIDLTTIRPFPDAPVYQSLLLDLESRDDG